MTVVENAAPIRDRRWRVERRRAERRIADLGSPYGTERRSGRDDRQGDRRGLAAPLAGIGLTRDYFAQGAALLRPPVSTVSSDLLLRFRG